MLVQTGDVFLVSLLSARWPAGSLCFSMLVLQFWAPVSQLGKYPWVTPSQARLLDSSGTTMFVRPPVIPKFRFKTLYIENYGGTYVSLNEAKIALIISATRKLTNMA